jgi:hypothetical protein
MELAFNRELTPDERKFLILANELLEKDRSCKFNKDAIGWSA